MYHALNDCVIPLFSYQDCRKCIQCPASYPGDSRALFLLLQFCGKALRDKLQKLQNRAARIITRNHYEIRSSQILNWPILEDRRMKQKSCLMYIKYSILSFEAI
jgi:hypothetical protein